LFDIKLVAIKNVIIVLLLVGLQPKHFYLDHSMAALHCVLGIVLFSITTKAQESAL